MPPLYAVSRTRPSRRKPINSRQSAATRARDKRRGRTCLRNTGSSSASSRGGGPVEMRVARLAGHLSRDSDDGSASRQHRDRYRLERSVRLALDEPER